MCPLSSDLPDISVSHSNLTVVEGDRVTAICNGSGSPLPEVDWPVTGLHSINAQEVEDTHTHTHVVVTCHVVVVLCLMVYSYVATVTCPPQEVTGVHAERSRVTLVTVVEVTMRSR